MKLLSADATMFLEIKKKNKNCPPKVKKTTFKICSEFLKSTFFPYCPDCPNGPNRRIHVPKFGLLTNCLYMELGIKHVIRFSGKCSA